MKFQDKMKIRFLSFLMLVFYSISAETLTAQQSDHFSIGTKSINTNTFENELKHILKQEGIPAISLAVIDDNQVVYYNAFGLKKRGTDSLVDKNTVFEAASLSKPFLTFAVARLMQRNKLNIDVPAFKYWENKALEHDLRYKKITPKMLLSHSSGIENWQAFYTSDTLEIISDPGSKFVYSGEGYHYLAKIVEEILGKPYETYLKETVLQPLQLERTFVTFNETAAENFATGHYYFGEPYPKVKNQVPVPASFNHTNALDIAKLITGYFNDRLLTKKTVNQLLEPVVSLPSKNRYHGLGFELQFTENDTIISHGGHNEGFLNFLYYSVATKKGFVYLTNSEQGIALVEKLNSMLTEFDLPTDEIYHGQYPSRVSQFVNAYQTNGLNDMMEKLKDTLNDLGPGLTSERLLNDIATVFAAEGYSSVAMRLLAKNQKLNPNSGLSYYLTGVLSYWDRDYSRGMADLKKAKELNFHWYPVDPYIKLSRLKFNQSKVKSKAPIVLSAASVKIEATQLSDMDGIEIRPVASEKEALKVSYYNAGNWVKYNINIEEPGYYKLVLKSTSDFDIYPNRIVVSSNQNKLGEIIVPDTGGWDNWQDIPLTVHLKKGRQALVFEMTSGSCDFRSFTVNKVEEPSK